MIVPVQLSALSVATATRPYPECGSVYFLVKNGCVVYVGQTKNLKNRLKKHSLANHTPYSVGINNWNEAYYVAEGEEEQRREIERREILRLAPKFNGGIGRPKGPTTPGSVYARRLVIYLMFDEVAVIKEHIKSLGITTPTKWAAQVLRRQLISSNLI